DLSAMGSRCRSRILDSGLVYDRTYEKSWFFRIRRYPDFRDNPSMDKRRSAAAERAAHFVDDYLPALLAQASHLISGEFHRVVTAKGFTVSEWRVLATLAGGEAMSIGRIAEITVMKQPTVTRVLDRMEASGHVKRLAHEADRRVTLVRITASGSRLAA